MVGVRTFLSIQVFDHLPTQRVHLLYYYEISIFDDGPFKFSKGAFGDNIC